MNPVDVLMPVPLDAFIIGEIDQRYRLHKLWEAADPQAFIAKVKDDVRFLVTSPSCRGIDGPFMSQFPNLKGVVNFGVGYDPVDAVWAAAHNIMVTHTPGVLNAEVADMAMGLTLAVVRQIPQADRFVRDGKWERSTFPLSASLIGRTMGIMGLGRIGKEIAKRAEAFGLKVIYNGRHQQQDVSYTYYSNLTEMAKACDILMIIAPGTTETKNCVNKGVLEALGPDGVLINMARGSLVDEAALVEALENKKILSAGLDVFAQEPHVSPRLIAIPQVVLLPHIGSCSFTTRHAIGQLVLDNLAALVAGQNPLTPVPEMSGK